jgi:hypothetical protein
MVLMSHCPGHGGFRIGTVTLVIAFRHPVVCSEYSIVHKFCGPCSVMQKSCYCICLQWGLSTCLREKYYCVHKRGNWSPLSISRGFSVYSMNKTGAWRKKNVYDLCNCCKLIEQLFSTVKFL